MNKPRLPWEDTTHKLRNLSIATDRHRAQTWLIAPTSAALTQASPPEIYPVRSRLRLTATAGWSRTHAAHRLTVSEARPPLTVRASTHWRTNCRGADTYLAEALGMEPKADILTVWGHGGWECVVPVAVSSAVAFDVKKPGGEFQQPHRL